MVAHGRREVEVVELAEKHEAKVLFEPSFLTFFSIAKRTRLRGGRLPRIRRAARPGEPDRAERPRRCSRSPIDCSRRQDRKHHRAQVRRPAKAMWNSLFVALALADTCRAAASRVRGAEGFIRCWQKAAELD